MLTNCTAGEEAGMTLRARSLAPFALALCAALSLNACGSGADPTDTSADDLAAAKAKKKKCTSTSQCTGGLVCLSGICQACTATSQCGAGLVCLSGTCQTPSTGCTDSTQCTSSGDLCNNGSCIASSCNQRGSGKTGIRATVKITRYQGLINGANGTHEIAYGTLQNVEWLYASSVKDTSNVQLAMNVASATDSQGLPHEVKLSVGQVIEVEGEYISAASANASGNAVIHFTHGICGFVNVGGTVYE
jgi:hypothetical protein